MLFICIKLELVLYVRRYGISSKITICLIFGESLAPVMGIKWAQYLLGWESGKCPGFSSKFAPSGEFLAPDMGDKMGSKFAGLRVREVSWLQFKICSIWSIWWVPIVDSKYLTMTNDCGKWQLTMTVTMTKLIDKGS